MRDNSKNTISNQSDINPDLEKIVKRHLSSDYAKPYRQGSEEIFEQLSRRVAKHRGQLIFDSGCGTGESVIAIAGQFPQALVIGVDKSNLRTDKARQKVLPENAMLIRADVIDIWRLAALANWRLARHFILYPNPWPKKQQFKRRWHGHPVFPTLLGLGGKIHLRSNWKIYLEEFAAAAKIAGKADVKIKVATFQSITPISAFEKKYSDSGHVLFQYELNLCDDPVVSSVSH